MKRKVIILGTKTYVISLPSPWVKKYGVKKGDELEVEEADESITVSTERGRAVEKVKKLDFSDFKSRSLIYNYTCSAYIGGADEIRITISTEEQSKIVREVVENLVGFVIVTEKKNLIVLKDVTGSKTEFESMLRRIFFMLNSIVSDGFESIKAKDYANLKECIEKDHKMNKYYFFCLRYLNKHSYHEHTRTIALYAFLNSLESVGDKYTEMYQYLQKLSKKLSPEFISLLESVNNNFIQLLDLFYVENQAEFTERVNVLKKSIPGFRDDIREFIGKANKEAVISAYLLAIIESINDSINNLLISSQAC